MTVDEMDAVASAVIGFGVAFGYIIFSIFRRK